MTKTRFSDRSILIVDDDDRWLRVIERWLEDVPYYHRLSSSALEALNAIDEKVFDVVVSDMSMPIVSGSDLMRHVKVKLPSAVRIVMSGKMDVVGSIEAINKGEVFRYIVKPCDAKSFKLAIYQALEIVERNEQKERRHREIQKSSAEKIRTMTRSMRSLEQVVTSAQDGLMAVFHQLLESDEKQKNNAAASLASLRRLTSDMDLDPAFSKELEVAIGLQQVAFPDSVTLTQGPPGKIVRCKPVSADLILFKKVLNILESLQLRIAFGVLSRMVAGDAIVHSIKPGDQRTEELGYALVSIAQDLTTLVQKYGQTDEESKMTIIHNSDIYCPDLLMTVFSTDSI